MGNGVGLRQGVVAAWREVMRAIIGTAVLWATVVLLLTSTVSRINAAANNIPQAPVGHRQPKTQDVQGVQENSADRTMKQIDENLKKKLNGICSRC
jgi:hypothetical protein